MHDVLNLVDFPIDRPESAEFRSLVGTCRAGLAADGMFNLNGFLPTEIAQAETQKLMPRMAQDSFRHARRHNIYFKPEVAGLAADDPVLALHETSNNTLCADQLDDTVLTQIYRWPPFLKFLAEVMEKDVLHPMADPLAGLNVMRYGDGQALNWHFDRSEFTVTLLLQAPLEGGVFEYRTGLRSATDPNFEGVRRLLSGNDPDVRCMAVTEGTLNVFQGVNTPHRVTPVKGQTPRMIAVFTYFEQAGVMFSESEQMGFYGRVAQ